MAKKQSSDFVGQIAAALKSSGYKSVADAQAAGSYQPYKFTKGHFATLNDLIGGIDYSKATDYTLNQSEREAQKILGKQGITLSSLDPQVQQYIHNANVADAQAAALGKPRKQHKSMWMKALDILSRPAYGSAEAVKEGLDKNVSGGGFLDTLGATGKGWLQGFEGKKKTTFSDVIQHASDLHHAADRGVQQKDILSQTKEKESHVNPWLKYGGGLAADVFLDPTTYLGVGVVTKGAKGAEAAAQVEKTAHAVNALKAAGHSETDAVRAVAGHLAPVERLGKKAAKDLSPEAQRIADVAKAYQDALKPKELKNLRKGAEGTAYLGKSIGDKQIKDILAAAETGKGAVKGITETALANAAPAVKKQFALRVGKAYVPVPGIHPAFKAMGGAALHVPGVEKSVAKFNDLFRAKAGIHAGLHGLRNEFSNGTGQSLVAYGRNLVSVMDKLPKDTRKQIMTSLRHGATDGNAVKGGKDLIGGTAETPVLQFVQDQLKCISNLADHYGMTPEDLNPFLPTEFRAPNFVHKGYDKLGNKVYKTAENPDWLYKHVMANPKFSDPATALMHLHAATQQIAAKHAMYEAAASEFGVKIPTRLGKKSKEIVSHSDRTKSLMSKGWREVRGIPSLKGHLFDPETAHGLERMNKVFGSRPDLNQFAHTVSKATSGFKAAVTLYNPAFSARTMLGEVMLNYLGGMHFHQIVPAYEKAWSVMRGRDRQLLGAAKDRIGDVGKLSRRETRSANILHSGAGAHLVAEDGAKPFLKTKYGMLTRDQIWHAYLNSGVKTGYASAEHGTPSVERSVAGKAGRKISAKVHDANEIVEDTGRLAQFIHEVQRSTAPTIQEAYREAAQKVMRVHLDYSAVTKTEQNISRYAIPFYKWVRLSTPLMADILLHDPGKALAVPKALSAASKAAGYDESNLGFMPASPDAMTPDFLRQHGAYPFFGKNTHYFDPTNLFPIAGSADLLDFTKDPKKSTFGNIQDQLLQRMNPLITKPLNAGKPDKMSEKDWFLNTLPQTRLGNQLVAPPDPDISRLERLLMYLLNPGFVANTPKKIKGEALKQRDAANTNRKKRQQELGFVGGR